MSSLESSEYVKYQWRIRPLDLGGVSRHVDTLWQNLRAQFANPATRRFGLGFLISVGVLLLLVLFTPLVMGLFLWGLTTVSYAAIHVIADHFGITVGIIAAVIVVVGGLGLLLWLLLRTLHQCLFRDSTGGWGRLLSEVRRVRFVASAVSWLSLGPLAYIIVACAQQWPESFRGSINEPRQWNYFFFDLILNGAFFNIPENLGRSSNIAPTEWYSKAAVGLFKVSLLHGVFWMIYNAAAFRPWSTTETFIGSFSEVTRHLREKHFVRSVDQVVFAGGRATGKVVILRNDESAAGPFMGVEVECLKVMYPTNPEAAKIHEYLREYLSKNLS